jgi:chromosome segregation ATPase
MDAKIILQEEIAKKEKQIEHLEQQIINSDRNITGLIAQKTRHMDRRDMLEAEKARLEAELTALEKEEAGG